LKIQLTYDRPAQIKTDLLVVILDNEIVFHDLNGSPLNETVRRIVRDLEDKRLKTDYFTSLDSKSTARNLAVFSTALSTSYNVWENVKIFRRAGHTHRQGSWFIAGLATAGIQMRRLPFVGKAAEGALLGSYSFDRYKKEKNVDQVQFNIVGLKDHEQKNRQYVFAIHTRQPSHQPGADMINEPGSRRHARISR